MNSFYLKAANSLSNLDYTLSLESTFQFENLNCTVYLFTFKFLFSIWGTCVGLLQGYIM